MLVKHYNEKGLTTHHKEVPDLLPCNTSVQAALMLQESVVHQKSKVQCKVKFSKLCDQVQKHLSSLAVQQGLQEHLDQQQVTLNHFHLPDKYSSEKWQTKVAITGYLYNSNKFNQG